MTKEDWTLIHTDKENNEWYGCKPPNDYPYIRIIYKEAVSDEELLELKKERVILKSSESYQSIYNYAPGEVYLLRYTRAWLYNDAAIIEYRVSVKTLVHEMDFKK